MRVIDKNPIYLYLSVVSFYISSFSIAFMPAAGYDELRGRALPISTVLAMMFWLGILSGIILTLVIRKKRIWDIKWCRNYMNTRRRKVPSFLLFYSNRPAIVFDTLLFVGIFILFLTQLHALDSFFPESFVWIVVFLTVFSFEMHLIFNGINYKWLKDPIETS